jgi:hypothetical protein
MKLILNIFTISCLYIATVWGQASHIGFPLAGDTIHFNANITVQIVRPVWLTILFCSVLPLTRPFAQYRTASKARPK